MCLGCLSEIGPYLASGARSARACSAGKSTLRMAELAALALRALAAGSAPAQDAARAAGAPPLLAVLLSPAQNRHMAEERKARKENAASAAAQAVLALADGNSASKVSSTVGAHALLSQDASPNSSCCRGWSLRCWRQRRQTL